MKSGTPLACSGVVGLLMVMLAGCWELDALRSLYQPDLGLDSPGLDASMPEDGSVDLRPALIIPTAIWIAPGGSAAAGALQLNLTIGGTDTAGVATEPGGTSFTPGYFCSQTN